MLQFGSPNYRAADLGLIGAWCNGSTADFGSVYPGSNPGASALMVSILFDC